jgi:hypothetical protein
MQEVVACAHRHPPHGRGTVGMVQVHPNSRNVIPGRVKFSIDLRNATDALVRRDGRRGQAPLPPAGAESGLPIEIEPVSATRRSPSMPSAWTRWAALPRSWATATCPAVRAPGTTPSTWPAGTGRHDLHPVQGRHQPQRDRGREAGTHRGRLQRAAARDAGTRRQGQADRHHADDGRVHEILQKVLLLEDLAVILQRRLEEKLGRPGDDVHLCLERGSQHPQEREQHDQRNGQDQQVEHNGVQEFVFHDRSFRFRWTRAAS